MPEKRLIAARAPVLFVRAGRAVEAHYPSGGARTHAAARAGWLDGYRHRRNRGRLGEMAQERIAYRFGYATGEEARRADDLSAALFREGVALMRAGRH